MRKLKSRIINQKKSISQVIANHIFFYPTPGNFSYAYSFGSIVGIFFVLQLLSGIFLAMHYVSDLDLAFSSVVHITNDVKYGYLMRYVHANGASIIFILLYLHIARALYFRSYTGARRWLWWSGIVIFLLMMATAFIGYVLPWGQMSFWGATVITNLVTAVPVVGEAIAYWIWGGYSVSGPTLTRFFSIHYLLPFLITGLILAHLIFLHGVTSTNPSQNLDPDRYPFHPYFTVKDIYAVTVTLFFFIIFVFFYPNLLGHPDNYIPANPLVTPPHIVPEWYFTPFYAILRACPNKLGGVIGMISAIVIWAILPFYKTVKRVPNAPTSGLNSLFFWLFIFTFLSLMVLGNAPATQPYVKASQVFSVMYFVYFLAILAFLPYLENYFLQYFDFFPSTTNQTVALKRKRKSTFRKYHISRPQRIIDRKAISFYRFHAK